jgi:type II secretory pathway pseudopilin PulG
MIVTRGHVARGFSLIETIGVLAIGALLAAALTPRMIKRIDLANRAQEVSNLSSWRDALTLNVLRSNTVPDSGGWAQAAATWSATPASQVSTNARRYNRIYFVQTSPNPSSLPYTQTALGTSKPANLRAIVISTLGGPRLDASNCPNPNGGALSDADFNLLWNTPDGSRPNSGLWANWTGAADDFVAQRIDYAPLFHHLVLINRDTNYAATFNINGSSAIAVTNNTWNAGWDSYYLDGTVVGLGDVTGTPMTRHVLTQDISFVFENGLWRAQVMGISTSNSQADNFAAKAASFLAAQWFPGAHQGGDQQGALTAMYSFMYTYTLWADQWPHFPSHNASSAVQVPEYELMDDVGHNSGFLDSFTGQGGLLK